jgi:hypothetical protein
VALTLGESNQPNLAPSEELLRNAQENAGDNSVEIEPEWFEQTRNDYEQEEKPTWEGQQLLWALIFLVIEGKTLLRRAKYGNGWRYPELPARTDTPVYGFNFTGFYSENIKAKWTSSNTDIRWRPQRDSDDALGATKAAQRVRDYLRRRIYTQSFKQLEALLAQCGKYARYYYYTEKEKSYGRRPRIEPQEMQLGESNYFCADCGGSGPLQPMAAVGNPPNDRASGMPDMAEPDNAGIPLASSSAMPQATGRAMGLPDAGMAVQDAGRNVSDSSAICPECGSPNINVEQSEPFQVEAVTGYDDIETGSIVCEPVPVFELKHETTKSPQDSNYLIRSRRVRVAELEYEYPDLKIRQGKKEDRGLAIEGDLKRSTYEPGGGMSGRDGVNETPTVDFTQVWLSPCLYARKRLKKDIQTASGQTIPAGTKLADVFKRGLYMCFIEGIKGPVELRDECHADYWVGGVLRQRAISSLGSGIEDIVNSNMQLNLVYSIIYEQLRTSAMPATLFDERLLPNGVSAYLGSLSNVPVQLAALDDRLSIRDAIFQLQPQPPTQQHFGYAEKLNQHMQLASRVTDFSGGLPGVNNDTATGAQITSANSQSLFGPQLANKAEVDRRGAEIELNLFKENQFDEMYVSLSGRRGEQDGVWLSAANINVDLYAEVVEESYLPQTNLERRERWDAFLQRVGGLPGLKAAMQESPDQVEQLADIFDVDLAGEDYEANAEICRERIEQMKAALPMLQVMQQGMPPVQMQPDPVSGQMAAVPVDPMAEAGQMLLGVISPPVEPEQLGHLASIRYLRTWRLTDEGKTAPPELWAGVKAMLYQHIDGLMAEAQMMGMVASAGTPMDQTGMQPGAESPKKQETNPNPQAKQMQPPHPQPARQPAMAGA